MNCQSPAPLEFYWPLFGTNLILYFSWLDSCVLAWALKQLNVWSWSFAPNIQQVILTSFLTLLPVIGQCNLFFKAYVIFPLFTDIEYCTFPKVTPKFLRNPWLTNMEGVAEEKGFARKFDRSVRVLLDFISFFLKNIKQCIHFLK